MEASKKPFLLENKKGEKKKGGNFFLYVFIGITCALALIVGLAFLVDLAIGNKLFIFILIRYCIDLSHIV